MSSIIGIITNLMSPAPAARPDPLSNVAASMGGGGGSKVDPEGLDDSAPEFERSATATRNVPRIVVTHKNDSPKMGVVEMSQDGTVSIFVGGKPLYDWSGLDPECDPATSPSNYRGAASKSSKDYHYRIKGLDKKIGPKNDFREVCRNVFEHLETHGLDTITYLPDPNEAVMESVVEKPNIFLWDYVCIQVPVYKNLWDKFDVQNDEAASKFLLGSLNEELLRKVRDAMASTTKPTFLLYWMKLAELFRVISAGRVDGLQEVVERRLPAHYPGQNLETMAEANIRDTQDMEQAGWFNLSTGCKMIRNFASANVECRHFCWFAMEIVTKYEKAVTSCLHMNKARHKGYMESQGFGNEEVCILFANYFRKANQDGLWLPTKTVRDTRGVPNNFANHTEYRALNLVQNEGAGSQGKATGTCHNCGEAGHWAKNCPSKTVSTDATVRTSHRGQSNRNGNSGSISWTKVPPTNGQPHTKSMHNKDFHWCDKCKRWSISHGTSEHRDNNGTGSNGNESKTKTNISLLATSTNFAAWHVSIDNEVEDKQEKENYWLDLVTSFAINFIYLPMKLAMIFTIGIVISVITLMWFLSITELLGHGIIAPIIWILTMMGFFYLHPIVSVVVPPDPPKPLLRWQKRMISKWMKENAKTTISNSKINNENNQFHRSYPLRLRSNNEYHLRRAACRRVTPEQRDIALHKLHDMHWCIKHLCTRVQDLLAENHHLKQHIRASRRYDPTPFERETVSPEEKAREHQKVLDPISKDFKKIQVVVDHSVPTTVSQHTFIVSIDKDKVKFPKEILREKKLLTYPSETCRFLKFSFFDRFCTTANNDSTFCQNCDLGFGIFNVNYK